MEKKFYSIEDVAEILSLNKMTIYRHIRSGELRAVKIGKKYRIPSTEIDRLANG